MKIEQNKIKEVTKSLGKVINIKVLSFVQCIAMSPKLDDKSLYKLRDFIAAKWMYGM